ncbi:MAG: VWA domain-containing protein, partial [Thermosynechococcaceae cyanobacterium]
MSQLDDLKTRQIRWRLILEAGTESILGQTPDGLWQQRADALTFLYDREYGSRNVRPGGSSGSGQRAASGQGASGGSSQPNSGQSGQGQGSPSSGASTQSTGTQRSPGNTQGAQSQGASSEPGESNSGTAKAQGQPTTGDSGSESSSGAGKQGNAGTAQGRSQDGQSTQTGQSGASGSTESGDAAVGAGAEQSDQGASCTGSGQAGTSGNGPGSASPSGPGSGDGAGTDATLAEEGQHSGDRSGPPSQDRHGGLGPSQLTVPEWINAIYELFPKKTIERLEKDALERYHLEEMVTNPDLLSRAEPSQALLKAVLRTKHLMNQDVLAMARLLVQRAIAELMEQLAREIQSPFLGAINRQRRSWLKVAKNFDAETTIRQNLSSYDPETKRLYIKTPYFHSRIRRQMDRWQIIIVVDESGSMLDSVIHAAVTASIFYSLKQVKTHLCIFDTTVVDLTDQCSDPVETLMQVQLGGGTDIGQALAYAESLVENPRNTIIILITDFFEGAPLERLLSVTHSLIESGVTLLGLAALDAQANPHYNRDLA